MDEKYMELKERVEKALKSDRKAYEKAEREFKRYVAEMQLKKREERRKLTVSEMMVDRKLFYAVHLENTMPSVENSILTRTAFTAYALANLINMTEGHTVRRLAEELAYKQVEHDTRMRSAA